MEGRNGVKLSGAWCTGRTTLFDTMHVFFPSLTNTLPELLPMPFQSETNLSEPIQTRKKKKVN